METCGPQQNDKEQTKSGNLNDAGCRLHLQTPDYNSLGWLVLQCLSNIFWSLVVVVVGVRVCDGCVVIGQIQNSWEQKFVVWSTGHVRLQLVIVSMRPIRDLLLGRALNA